MKGGYEESPNHAAADQARKSIASQVAMSHRSHSPVGGWTLNMRTFIRIAYTATTDPIVAVVEAAAQSRTGHHRQKVSFGWQLAASSMIPSLQSSTSTKTLWRVRPPQVLHVLWGCDSLSWGRWYNPHQVIHHITQECSDQLVRKTAAKIHHILGTTQRKVSHQFPRLPTRPQYRGRFSIMSAVRNGNTIRFPLEVSSS
jgi:hypothetical protein